MHEVTMTAISVQNFIKIEICSMAKVVRRKTMYKTYGIFPIRRKRKKKKKIRTKTIAFPLCGGKANQRFMSVCITEHKAFPTSGPNLFISLQPNYSRCLKTFCINVTQHSQFFCNRCCKNSKKNPTILPHMLTYMKMGKSITSLIFMG